MVFTFSSYNRPLLKVIYQVIVLTPAKFFVCHQSQGHWYRRILCRHANCCIGAEIQVEQEHSVGVSLLYIQFGLVDFCSGSGNCRHYHAHRLRCDKLEHESGNQPPKSSEVCSLAVDGLPSILVLWKHASWIVTAFLRFLSIWVLFGSFFMFSSFWRLDLHNKASSCCSSTSTMKRMRIPDWKSDLPCFGYGYRKCMYVGVLIVFTFECREMINILKM